MMHHPNMHHQPMSGHPPQHLPGHQAMPAHHQMPPHQMHRENRHVTLTRVPLGPSQAGGGMGAHGQMGGLGAMGVPPHHAPTQRPPHAIRPMHHPPAQHHSVPPPSRPMRRPYSVGGAYAAAGAGVMPPYAQPPPPPAPHPAQPPLRKPHTHLNNRTVPPAPASVSAATTAPVVEKTEEKTSGEPPGQGAGSGAGDGDEVAGGPSGPDDAPRPPPAPSAPANSKEKTPMCLVNELARYNKIKHQYRLTSETGPAHKKVFTVTLRLGDTEEYTAEGSSIKRAQHAAAAAALAGTGFPAPPPRAAPAHAPPHARHATAVMPTVELNALAMKLCQPALYTAVPPAPAPHAAHPAGPHAAGPRRARPPPYRLPLLPPYPPHPPHPPHPRLMDSGPPMLYRVRVSVGGRSWVGEGGTPQAARHDAAARALLELRPPRDHTPPDHDDHHDHDTPNGDANGDLLNSEVKSPVSLVHELALKRNLSVQFTVKSERGPPHMRVFVTMCTVGEMETEGQGNGKKVSKRRAAERMLAEMRLRWPPAALRPRPPADRRRAHQPKKKPRNLIKEGGAGGASSPGGGAGGGGAGGGAAGDNPISRLAVARHAARARSPQYRVLEERGAARRREFLVQCDAPPHCATGLGPNKKTAKRRAAHNVLLAMEMSANGESAGAAGGGEGAANGNTDANKTNNDIKRKEGEGGGSSDIRQPVPGVLVMDYHQRSGQPAPPNGISETSATGGGGGGGGGTGSAGGSTPGAKDQLMYLSQLLGFTVQFSDFPKRNHGEYLSLVSLSTEPPVMCHGGGASTAHSHEQCARAALRALALMGLDAPTTGIGISSLPGAGAAAKPNIITNGITE